MLAYDAAGVLSGSRWSELIEKELLGRVIISLISLGRRTLALKRIV